MSNTFIIAEAGVNHNGSLELAKELIEVAAHSGANAVKFQTFCTEELLIESAPKANYQRLQAPPDETQYRMLKQLELSENNHFELFQHAAKNNIQFLSTPFDLQSLELLNIKLKLPLFKVASGEITNAPFLWNIAKTLKPIILSTGMATLGEIENALAILAFGYLNPDTNWPETKDLLVAYRSVEGQSALQQNVTLLHCTTDYPTSFKDVNLKAMDTLAQAFNLPIGYSDHTRGIEVSIAAVARGATVIEKHFTLDKQLPGPDHAASITPSELETMIQSIRHVEQSIGLGLKFPTSTELTHREVARKSLVALCQINPGDVFTERNLGTKRPGSGISSTEYWSWLGRTSVKCYERNELIHE